MSTETISLQSFDEFCFAGGHDAELRGRWDPPTGPTTGYALFTHCFTRTSPTLLVGHSLGGAAVLAATESDQPSKPETLTVTERWIGCWRSGRRGLR